MSWEIHLSGLDFEAPEVGAGGKEPTGLCRRHKRRLTLTTGHARLPCSVSLSGIQEPAVFQHCLTLLFEEKSLCVFFLFESDTKCFSTVTTCLQAVLGRSLLPGQQGQGWPTCLLYSQSHCLSDSFDFGSRTQFLLAHAIATGSHKVNSPLILQIRSSQLCVPCFTCDKGLSATCLCPPAGITRFLDK